MCMKRSCIFIWNFILLTELLCITTNAQFAQIGHESIPLHLFKPVNGGNNANFVAQKSNNDRIPRNQNTYVHESLVNQQSKSGAKEIKSDKEIIEHEPVVNLESSSCNKIVAKNEVSSNGFPDVKNIITSRFPNFKINNDADNDADNDDNNDSHLLSFAKKVLNDPNSVFKSFNAELPADGNTITHTDTDENGNRVSRILKTFKTTKTERKIINENENHNNPEQPHEDEFDFSNEHDSGKIFSNNNNGKLMNKIKRLFNSSIFDELPTLSHEFDA